jgi:hypothetical protein
LTAKSLANASGDGVNICFSSQVALPAMVRYLLFTPEQHLQGKW